MIAKLMLFSRQDGSTSFKMKLTDKGKRGYEAVEVPFTKKDWNYDTKKRKNELKKRMPSHKDYQSYLANKAYVDSMEAKYQKQIDKLISTEKSFSFNQVFKLVLNPKKEKPQTFYTVFDAYIKDQKSKEAYGNAANIKGTLNKLKKFHTKDLLFNEIDSTFLMKFKYSMVGLSNHTISIHLRNIRTVYNYAIKKLNVASLADYPFIDGDIQGGLKTAYKSRALKLSEVESIRAYRKTLKSDTPHWHACNYFIIGYAGRGLNYADIARLKWDNIYQNRIEFVRHKTRSKITEQTSFPITDELNEIISWYRKNNRQLGNPYIFPILNASHKTEKSKFYRTKKTRTQLNKNLGEIKDKLELSIPITTYVWRHTFANVAKNDKKIDVSMISEMLGHHDLQTTKHYLKNFPDPDLDKATAGM